MTEDEILIRAREAAIAVHGLASIEPAEIRSGRHDRLTVIQIAAQALRDLAKPLSEIQPVDPDEQEAIRFRNNWGGGQVDMILAAIRRGRDLERGE